MNTEKELRRSLQSLADLVETLYQHEFAGGPLHIITDDGNVSDYHILFCYRHLHMPHPNSCDEIVEYSVFLKSICGAILHELMLMTHPQRIVWWVAPSIQKLGVDPVPIMIACEKGQVRERDNGGYDDFVVLRDHRTGEEKVVWEGLEQLQKRLEGEK